MKSRIVLAILIVIWMITVFCFSNDNSQKSSNKSEKIVEVISQICDNKIREKDKLETIVRKSAHMLIYTIGGILFFLYFNTYDIVFKKKIIYSIIICVIYAITDEIHQGFVPGRSPQITDILIDTAGVNIGIVISYWILKINKKIYNKNEGIKQTTEN